MEPSGANKGFFQQQPILKNQWRDDAVLQRVVKRLCLSNTYF
jgi:hypothetical protein